MQPARALAHADSAALDAALSDQMSAPRELVSDAQLETLERRLEALHAAKLLSDDDFGCLEDCVADGIEAMADCDALTRAAVQHLRTYLILSNPVVSKLHKLIVLSEKMPQDGMFARQARRKFGPT